MVDSAAGLREDGPVKVIESIRATAISGALSLLSLLEDLGLPKPHCWHSFGGMAHESAYWCEDTCCWCGAHRNVTYLKERDPMHGPYVWVGKTIAVVVTEKVGPACSVFDQALPEPPAWCCSRP